MKKLFKPLLFSVLAVLIAAPIFWTATGTNELSAEDRAAADFAELLTVFEGFLFESQRGNSPGRDERMECIRSRSRIYDERYLLVREFDYLLHKAVRIRDAAKGCERSAQGHTARFLITMMAGPSAVRATTSITFIGERYYLGLIDLLVEFSGIERELFVIDVCEYVPTIGIDVLYIDGYFDEDGNFFPDDPEAWEEMIRHGQESLKQFWREHYPQYAEGWINDFKERIESNFEYEERTTRTRPNFAYGYPYLC